MPLFFCTDIFLRGYFFYAAVFLRCYFSTLLFSQGNFHEAVEFLLHSGL